MEQHTKSTDPITFIDQILLEHGHPEKVCFKSQETVNNIIEQIIQAGATKLQVITDFDFTLSKHHTKHASCNPAADIIRQSPVMSNDFKARARQRYDQLLPVELDNSLTIEQKIPTVIASFQEGFADLVNSKKLNKKIIQEMIANADETCNFQLRDHCEKTFECLHEAQVPVLIFSAGFGDLVEGILHKYSMYYPNNHVIGNFMEFNDEDGELLGFKPPLIHTFNKNETVIPANSQYFDELTSRTNVILLGDSIGDVSMADGVTGQRAILKIGFLNEVDQQQLHIFLTSFDIVLLDDQTMDFVNCLFNKIL